MAGERTNKSTFGLRAQGQPQAGQGPSFGRGTQHTTVVFNLKQVSVGPNIVDQFNLTQRSVDEIRFNV